ncbi:C10 family peptidase [Polyangium aurulentum]|uniref:C10 family peptidase n=1 Tax=Polyangium aurulentum TaxID=2567896 RepID=UPI0010AE81BB|nr:C10 family peptidase [Polyangium aurulentum]UQA59812.1 C10 family peptidase [Polyangium aurulentum]
MNTLKVGRRSAFLYSLTFLALLQAGCAVEPDDQFGEEDPTTSQEALGGDPDLIPLEEAKSLATGLLAKEAATSRVRQIKDQHVERENDVPVLYVFNFTEGGFAVVSADKRQAPVLAYADKGSFDMRALRDGALPEGVAEWMEHAREVTRDIRSGRTAALSDRKTYERFKADTTQNIEIPGGGGPCSGSYTNTKQLNMPAQWNQGCGYNDEAPLASGGPCGRAWAGCVAVAMGQVMKYYQYPGGYNWAGMYNYSSTPDTAHLLRDVGNSVGMSYGANGSGASMGSIDNALENFGYSTSAEHTSYGFWKVRDEIIANRPVIMSGTKDCDFLGFPTCSGHAWVVDGYKESFYCETQVYYNYLRNNWGWGGNYDGWYYDYKLNPGGKDYSYHNELIIGIKP